MNQSLISPIRQHSLDAFLIAICDNPVNIQQPLTLVRFLRQNVTRVRMTAFDFAGRGDAKSLGRAFVCF